MNGFAGMVNPFAPRVTCRIGAEPVTLNTMSIRVIFLGDIVGQIGVNAVCRSIPALRERYKPDLIIANAENAYNGSGLTPKLYEQLCQAGIHGMTMGDHVFKRAQIAGVMEQQSNIIRPANLSPKARGKTWMRLSAGDAERDDKVPQVFVITVLGRIFTSLPVNDPFAAVESVLAQLPVKDPIVIVEIHAETTSEKKAIGWYFDGKVAAVIGTHTHVATADATVLPKGTGYITDIGMCGPHESVLGRRVDRVLTFMTTNMPAPFDVAENDLKLNGVVLDINPDTRQTLAIERLELPC